MLHSFSWLVNNVVMIIMMMMMMMMMIRMVMKFSSPVLFTWRGQRVNMGWLWVNAQNISDSTVLALIN